VAAVDNSTIATRIQSSDGIERKAMKILRNIIGTAGLIYAGYILIASVKDVRRYIRISTM
jgi:hypothetical protein